MRLVRALERLEGAAAAARAPEPARVGLVWTCDDVRIDVEELAAGEYVAVDLVMGDELDETTSFGQILERVTYDVGDLGVVRNASGERIGVVTAVDGTLLTWRADSGADS
jgi:hypothetical protein